MIRVINKKKRTFNGIKYNQITEVSKDNLDVFLRAWFEVFKEAKNITKEEKIESEREKYIKILQENSIKFTHNSKTETLKKKVDKLLKEKEESEATRSSLEEKMRTNWFDIKEKMTIEEIKKILEDNWIE